MKHLRASFLLILLVGVMGVLTACGSDTPTATVAVTAADTPTTAPVVVDTPTTAPVADTPTTAAMVADTPTTAMAADTPTTAAMAADTPTTAAMTADTPTASTGSGTGTGITDPTLSAAMTAMKAVKSYHFTMTTDMGTTGTTSAEGDAIPPDKTRLTTKVSAAGQTMETTTIIIGGDVWTNVGGVWNKSSMGSNPMANVADLTNMGQISDVKDLGDDTVDGIAAKHLSYKSSMADPTGAGNNLSGTAEIWIDKATNHVVQVKSTSETAAGSATVTIKYSRFDDPSITIDPPQ